MFWRSPLYQIQALMALSVSLCVCCCSPVECLKGATHESHKRGLRAQRYLEGLQLGISASSGAASHGIRPGRSPIAGFGAISENRLFLGSSGDVGV